jgi:hypothetical protein
LLAVQQRESRHIGEGFPNGGEGQGVLSEAQGPLSMSFTRRHSRPDSVQNDIVNALRAAGVLVCVIGRPVDLLTFYRGKWLPLECKTTKRPRKDQAAQTLFLAATGVPKVRTALEALEAVISPIKERSHVESVPKAD